MDPETSDPSRRALLAALAGGLALAAPAPAEGKKGKQKPPLAFAAVVVTQVVLETQDDVAGFRWAWEASFFKADGQAASGPSGGSTFAALGTDARAAIAADARADAASILGVSSSGRIAVEIL